MDDPQHRPADPLSPGYQAKRDEVAARRTPPGGEDEIIDVTPELAPADPSAPLPIDRAPYPEPHPTPTFASEPIVIDPVVETTPANTIADTDADVTRGDALPLRPDEDEQTPPPADALPGDAAPNELIPLKDDAAAPPHPALVRDPQSPTAPGPRGGSFALGMLAWLVVWAGLMALTLNHRFDRKFDWNTSYFSICARNLLTDGFVASNGGLYLTAGDFKGERQFYAGHPPLTAWLLAGWMRAFGQDEFAIRALPLTFTALNLLLLYTLVRRAFGAPAALATAILCSLLPMTAYYGQVVNMEPFVLTFMLGAANGYLGWARSGSKLGFLLLCLCVVLGCWTDWPMYVFTGLLAVSHFFRRRDLVMLGRGEETPGRPIFSTLVLLALPVILFGLFLVYLNRNGADYTWLTDRAKHRMTDGGGSGGPSSVGGYRLLLGRVTKPGELLEWFVSLFTPAALMLAGLGLLTWRTWSRRLSIASGEAARRAAFRLLVCLILTQVVYTLAFPGGAVVHEFWQYYLTVPVGLLAAGFCTWLTVAGGVGDGGGGRSFRHGFFDRTAWAVAALIPLLAVGPIAYRMNAKVPWKDEVRQPDARLDDAFARALKDATRRDDVILTDWTEEPLGYALPWYTDRRLIPHQGTAADIDDTHSLDGINKLRAQHKNRRILYLWGDVGPSELEQKLNTQFRQFQFGRAIAYLIQGEPDPAWKRAGTNWTPPATSATGSAAAPLTAGPTPVATPPTTRPDGAPATTPSTTRPAP
jgi:4-amino-4-deoxy-L-arabinose transferase-like glycosyltransferase